MEAPERVEVESANVVRLSWPDGAVTELSAAQLRDRCPCADCRTARETPPPRLRLTVLGSEPSVVDAHLVGDYGLGVTFGPDGHRTGIFTWEMLRSAAVDSSDTSS